MDGIAGIGTAVMEIGMTGTAGMAAVIRVTATMAVTEDTGHRNPPSLRKSKMIMKRREPDLFRSLFSLAGKCCPINLPSGGFSFILIRNE
ncbi:hypothetical protein [Paenibacillus rigui]|uniref:hypothetical protein n=1 Tax=Paenibacillus rigui TaxID=554312 RepID=UPI000B8B32D1|nr:hypothetical protein [Paenibacillus rigui]